MYIYAPHTKLTLSTQRSSNKSQSIFALFFQDCNTTILPTTIYKYNSSPFSLARAQYTPIEQTDAIS